jgi:hypothetical protein
MKFLMLLKDEFSRLTDKAVNNLQNERICLILQEEWKSLKFRSRSVRFLLFSACFEYDIYRRVAKSPPNAYNRNTFRPHVTESGRTCKPHRAQPH